MARHNALAPRKMWAEIEEYVNQLQIYLVCDIFQKKRPSACYIQYNTWYFSEILKASVEYFGRNLVPKDNSVDVIF